MGGSKSKVDRSNANVINDITVDEKLTVNTSTIEVLLVVICVLLIIQILMRVYKMHTHKLRKKYLTRAASLNAI